VKIGARIVGHGRSVIFQMAEVAVPRGRFQQILAAIATLRPSPPARCPDLAIWQASNLLPAPLPRTSISWRSGCGIFNSPKDGFSAAGRAVTQRAKIEAYTYRFSPSA